MDIAVGDAINVIRLFKDEKIHGNKVPDELCDVVHAALALLAKSDEQQIKKGRQLSSLDIDDIRQKLGCEERKNSLRDVLTATLSPRAKSVDSPRTSRRSSPRVASKDWEFMLSFCDQHREYHEQEQRRQAAASEHGLNQLRFQTQLPKLKELRERILQSIPEEHSVEFNEACQLELLDLKTCCEKHQKACSAYALHKRAMHWEAFSRVVTAAHLAIYRDLEARWDSRLGKLSKRKPAIDTMCAAIDVVIERIQSMPDGESRIVRRKDEQRAVSELTELHELLAKRVH